MANARNAILKAMIEQQLIELFPKTGVANVIVDESTGMTLATQLSLLITSLNKKLEKEEVQRLIQTSINELINGAPETADTLKELSDLIAHNASVAEALSRAIGTKQDKETGKGLSTNDFTDGHLAKVNAFNPDWQHTHSNKTTLDAIEAQDLLNWDAKSTVFVQRNMPDNMKAQDLFIQIVE